MKHELYIRYKLKWDLLINENYKNNYENKNYDKTILEN